MFQNNLNQQYQKLWPFRLTHLAHWYLFGEVSLGSICTFLQAFIIISKHIIFCASLVLVYIYILNVQQISHVQSKVGVLFWNYDILGMSSC